MKERGHPGPKYDCTLGNNPTLIHKFWEWAVMTQVPWHSVGLSLWRGLRGSPLSCARSLWAFWQPVRHQQADGTEYNKLFGWNYRWPHCHRLIQLVVTRSGLPIYFLLAPITALFLSQPQRGTKGSLIPVSCHLPGLPALIVLWLLIQLPTQQSCIEFYYVSDA